MATLLIRSLDEAVKKALRIRAAENGRSMEAEARQILMSAMREEIASKPVAASDPRDDDSSS